MCVLWNIYPLDDNFKTPPSTFSQGFFALKPQSVILNILVFSIFFFLSSLSYCIFNCSIQFDLSVAGSWNNMLRNIFKPFFIKRKFYEIKQHYCGDNVKKRQNGPFSSFLWTRVVENILYITPSFKKKSWLTPKLCSQT